MSEGMKPEDSKIIVMVANCRPYAAVSKEGVLTSFDNVECRRMAQEYDPAHYTNGQAIAMLCIALLEQAAQQVDHILIEGGGTCGDLIRGLNVDDGG